MNNKQKIVSAIVAGTILMGANSGCAKADKKNNSFLLNEDFNTEYVVEPGDTLTLISLKKYGTNDFYQIIADYNRLANADSIYVGQVLVLPGYTNDQILTQTIYSDDMAYEVKKGDTLSSICLAVYGDTSLTLKLATYNDLNSPHYISEGEVLFLPHITRLEKVVEKDYSLADIEYYNNLNYLLTNGLIPPMPDKKPTCDVMVPGKPLDEPQKPCHKRLILK